MYVIREGPSAPRLSAGLLYFVQNRISILFLLHEASTVLQRSRNFLLDSDCLRHNSCRRSRFRERWKRATGNNAKRCELGSPKLAKETGTRENTGESGYLHDEGICPFLCPSKFGSLCLPSLPACSKTVSLPKTPSRRLLPYHTVLRPIVPSKDS